jgi:hypothetical protein
MSTLFEVAEVIDGDGPWSGVPYDEQYDDAARPLIVQDVCTRANVALVAGSTSDVAVVYTIRPFGAMVSAQRPNRCVLGEFPDFDAALESDLKLDSERAASYVLWNGIPGWTGAQPTMVNSDVAVSGTGTTIQETVAKVLDLFYAGEVGKRPILHMGETAAMQLSAGSAMSPEAASSEYHLVMDGTAIVVSPHYPTAGVAATGPIKVRRTRTGVLVPAYDYTLNRTYFTTEMIMAVEFDASIAVRAA